MLFRAQAPKELIEFTGTGWRSAKITGCLSKIGTAEIGTLTRVCIQIRQKVAFLNSQTFSDYLHSNYVLNYFTDF